jgi:hypothetical protein
MVSSGAWARRRTRSRARGTRAVRACRSRTRMRTRQGRSRTTTTATSPTTSTTATAEGRRHIRRCDSDDPRPGVAPGASSRRVRSRPGGNGDPRSPSTFERPGSQSPHEVSSTLPPPPIPFAFTTFPGTSSASTRSTRAATSPRGKSRSTSPRNCGRRSGHSAERARTRPLDLRSQRLRAAAVWSIDRQPASPRWTLARHQHFAHAVITDNRMQRNFGKGLLMICSL